MREIALDQLQEGMRVVCDIHDRHGNVTVHAGEALTEQTIRGLRASGVSEVEIDERLVFPRLTIDKSFPPEVLELAENEIADVFHLADVEHPMLMELRRLCMLRRARCLKGRM